MERDRTRDRATAVPPGSPNDSRALGTGPAIRQLAAQFSEGTPARRDPRSRAGACIGRGQRCGPGAAARISHRDFVAPHPALGQA